MANLSDLYAEENNDIFKDRVAQAVRMAAQAIYNDNTRVPEHPWCLHVIQNPNDPSWLIPIVDAVWTNTTIQSEGLSAPDSDIIFVVNSVLTEFSLPAAS